MCGYIFFLLGIYLGEKLLDHMIVICLTVQQAAKQFSKSGCTILHFPHTLLEVMENGKAVTLKNKILK